MPQELKQPIPLKPDPNRMEPNYSLMVMARALSFRSFKVRQMRESGMFYLIVNSLLITLASIVYFSESCKVTYNFSFSISSKESVNVVIFPLSSTVYLINVFFGSMLSICFMISSPPISINLYLWVCTYKHGVE